MLFCNIFCYNREWTKGEEMFIIDFILHIDEHIYNIANAVGGWTYLILFLVIF